jgi:hypothetical protein
MYYIDRVSKCYAIGHVSLDAELSPERFACKWIGNVSVGVGIITICKPNTSGTKMLFLSRIFIPICIWSRFNMETLRWHISVGCHGISKRANCPGNDWQLKEDCQRSELINDCYLSRV